jgi:vacuolar-type H+-ATPase subunit H
MSEIQEASHAEHGILAHSLNDYRSKVEDIIRTENERFRELAEEQAKTIIDSAWQKAENIIAESQKKAGEIIAAGEKKAEEAVEDSQQKALKISSEIEQKAHQRYAEIVDEAQQKAQLVIREADEKARKEAKNRVKLQEEKIIAKAKEDAASLITDMKNNAEKEKNEIIARAQKEAEQRREEEIARLQAEIQTQSANILAEAEKKATNLINAIVSGSNEVNDMIIKTMKNSEAILEKLKNELNAEIGELTSNIVTTRNKLEQMVVTALAEKSEENTLLRKGFRNSNNNAVIWVALDGEKSAQRDDNTYLFTGRIELKALPSTDHPTLKNLKNFFNQVPNIKYLGESYTEEGYMLTFEIKEPLPLIDILSKIPSVEKVVTLEDSLKLILT